MKLKASQYLDGKKPRKFYIIRPEIKIEYTKHKLLGGLYIFFNYWRFVKIGCCQILCDTAYYIAFPVIYRKVAEYETM